MCPFQCKSDHHKKKKNNKFYKLVEHIATHNISLPEKSAAACQQTFLFFKCKNIIFLTARGGKQSAIVQNSYTQFWSSRFPSHSIILNHCGLKISECRVAFGEFLLNFILKDSSSDYPILDFTVLLRSRP